MKEKIGKHSPLFFKKAFRLVRYRNERNKFFREIGIRRRQDQLLQEGTDAGAEKLIVFIIPGCDWKTGKDMISGGTISVVSICEETAGMKAVHGAQTVMCTMRGDHLFLRHEKFENNTDVFRFEQLAARFSGAKGILIHLPEFIAEYFVGSLSAGDRKWLGQMDNIHINILNQNIQLMPTPAAIGEIRTFADRVTITTAHQKYCTQSYRDHFGVPIHKLSVWISPEQYIFKEWKDKEHLLVVSPDKHPMKEEIMALLQGVNGLTVQVISNLTYRQYKELIARAKWSLTFGEGLDGYLIEPVFSGAVGFAVYNESFFTKDFGQLPTVYPSYEALKERIVGDMAAMDDAADFTVLQQEQFRLCAKYYSKEQYRKNIVAFYNGEYSFP